MNNYDAWKLASPPESAPQVCECGHSEENHGVAGVCFICRCDRYTEIQDEGPDPDRAYDLRREGW